MIHKRANLVSVSQNESRDGEQAFKFHADILSVVFPCYLLYARTVSKSLNELAENCGARERRPGAPGWLN